METIRVSFPHLGSYHTPMKVLFTFGFDVEYIAPPPITERTLSLGSRYSPEYVCAPFKYNLGNFIETIEAGANTLVQTGGTCRLRYYGELHEQILRDLGYKVKFINIAKVQDARPTTLYRELKEINPEMSLKRITETLPVVVKMIGYIDKVEDYIRKNVGFETIPGSFDKVHASFLSELGSVRSRKELNRVYRKYMRLFKKIEVQKPANPLKVGIVGEYYTVMEPFSNHNLERELARKGIVVDRWLNVSSTLFHYPKKKIEENTRDYVKYPMGATAMATIDRALECAKKGFDGIIHVKSFGCTPETDVIPVLQNISKDYNIPVLYLTFDTQNSDVGFITRLEAFYDMIKMRKEMGQNLKHRPTHSNRFYPNHWGEYYPSS
jgi:predicted nucleotide-binding protein (sugar kinase/HSP70/actin superfamily)